MTNSLWRIGKAEATVGHYEFLDKNYVRAKELLKSSVVHLHSYRYNCLMSTVDYAKTLIKLHENQSAKNILCEALDHAESENDIPLEIRSQLLILLSIYTNEYKFAESVFMIRTSHRKSEC